MKIGILASGNLGFTTLQFFCEKFQFPDFIATDKNSKLIIEFAERHSIKLFLGNPRNGRLREFIGDENLGVLFSINYLFLLDKEVINNANFAINIHGSLLPKYRGRTPHVWAIINNEKITGVTAHLIDEGCDTGDIIVQKKIKILSTHTGADILAEFEKIYPFIISEVFDKINLGTIASKSQDNSKATYYGKRTPEDGEINWSWQKERIRNWVRAQAFPYPGAFTYCDNQKVIIDKIIFSSHGFSSEQPNGLVLSDKNGIIVKTPNGTVKLNSIRINKDKIKLGRILGK
ncbi:methionyl-tRNA formyltransferase [Aquirufa aurantiipilula]